VPAGTVTVSVRLSVAVVLTLELAKIARSLVCLDHVASGIVDPDDGVM